MVLAAGMDETVVPFGESQTYLRMWKDIMKTISQAVACTTNSIDCAAMNDP